MQKEYKTVSNFGNAVVEEKKSKFIASVIPVKTEEEVNSHIAQIKTKYWDARHNVYSYYIFGNTIVQRYSDDGEPAGTAGIPILEVIKRTAVQDILIVVTRYFGGTLLGAAGLIRAYSKAASLGIENAGIIKKQLCTEITIILEYNLFGKVQSLILNNGYNIKCVKYEQDVEIVLYVAVDDVECFTALIVDATNARALVEIGGNDFITTGEDGKLIL